ncbi:MAG: exodeoxyribonuclease VII large subunit [Deltaproteobacteria bacterium]|nr:exodeoxyribonuclease VII large subunit [Deltaproteobacteria bacterium]
MNDSFEHAKTTVYSVSALSQEIKNLLEESFDFVWVEGEISNFRNPSSGHYYMVIKDEKAQIRAVMFRPRTRYLKFMPEDGMKVIVQGRIGIYEPRGEYQLVLDFIEPLGVGALALAFEQLKRKLAEQGVFDETIKKPLPFLPQRVAVITSPTGAAIRDFLKIIHRRFANIEITLVPAKVQGEGAAEEMVEALETVNRELEADVIVLTRGGGSLEDLWAFNSEALALAIRASRIAVVSAVGHEIDVTISDLAADFRAPTPSAAAELLVAEKESLTARIEQNRRRLSSALQACVAGKRDRLRFLSRGLRDPRKRLADSWMDLEGLQSRLARVMEIALKTHKRTLAAEGRAIVLHSPLSRIDMIRQKKEFQKRTLIFLTLKKLKDLKMEVSLGLGRIAPMNPLGVLERGYSMTRKIPEGWIVRSSRQMEKGDQVSVKLARGELQCRVEKVLAD